MALGMPVVALMFFTMIVGYRIGKELAISDNAMERARIIQQAP